MSVFDWAIGTLSFSTNVKVRLPYVDVLLIQEVNRRSDSGVDSMLVEQRPGTPGSSSIQSSGR